MKLVPESLVQDYMLRMLDEGLVLEENSKEVLNCGGKLGDNINPRQVRADGKTQDFQRLHLFQRHLPVSPYEETRQVLDLPAL